MELSSSPIKMSPLSSLSLQKNFSNCTFFVHMLRYCKLSLYCKMNQRHFFPFSFPPIIFMTQCILVTQNHPYCCGLEFCREVTFAFSTIIEINKDQIQARGCIRLIKGNEIMK